VAVDDVDGQVDLVFGGVVPPGGQQGVGPFEVDAVLVFDHLADDLVEGGGLRDDVGGRRLGLGGLGGASARAGDGGAAGAAGLAAAQRAAVGAEAVGGAAGAVAVLLGGLRPAHHGPAAGRRQRRRRRDGDAGQPDPQSHR
jgi:hypothetical protein